MTTTAERLGWKVTYCRGRGCGAPMVWALTLRGRLHPVDAEPRRDGNLVIFGWSSRGTPQIRVVDADDEPASLSDYRWVSHMLSCPDEGKWRPYHSDPGTRKVLTREQVRGEGGGSA